MHVLYDEKLISNLNLTAQVQFESVYQSHKNYEISIFDQHGYLKLIDKSISLEKIENRLLLKSIDETITAERLLKINPTFIIDRENYQLVNSSVQELIKKHAEQQLKYAVRDSVENKRRELEKLNHFLEIQEKERSAALKIFQNEELVKKQNEKKLLFFLDFINSVYEKNDFLDELFIYLWSEIKKIDRYYQLGLILKFHDQEEAFIFQYDDKKYYSLKKSSFDFINDENVFSKQLANINQRPVGKLLSWTKETTKVNFCIYLESHHKSESSQIDIFMTQRIDLISMILTRWILDRNEQRLIQKWKDIFQSYSDPIHVINDQYEIIQSNYSLKGQKNKKCYEILAERSIPCENCPTIIREKNVSLQTQSQIMFKGENYDVISTDFVINEVKYFLNFYENKTAYNQLKSEIIQSEKMSTIGHLANHLAHELNNPLTGLKMTTEFILNSQDEMAAQKGSLISDLKEVSKAILRSEIIIKDLMDFSYDKADRIQLVDIEPVFRKTLTLLKSVMRNHKLFFDIKPTRLMIQPLYLQQVIFNLVKNSCEAMTSPGIIKIYEMKSDSKNIDFIIEDSGPGLVPALAENIFKPFFSTKKEGEGTGLGLYLCAQLMKKMDAILIYDYNYHAGARFILRFARYE